MSHTAHTSVLLRESLTALVVNTQGLYIDGTFGRGGHSRELLQRLAPEGRLLAFDKDPQAIAAGRLLELEDARFSMVHGSFTELANVLPAGKSADGILLDLGVSSPQLDDAGRGFSFMQDGPLDMRMDNSRGPSAADWLNTASEQDIARVLREYGEERFSGRMARALLDARAQQPLQTTLQFAQIIRDANPRWERDKHPATRAFQAVRIFVNRELDDLKDGLESGLECLSHGGRFVVISFHSLEDRIVKRFFRLKARGQTYPPEVPVTESMLNKRLKIIGKPLKASEQEIKSNVRARSAVMRVAEKMC